MIVGVCTRDTRLLGVIPSADPCSGKCLLVLESRSLETSANDSCAGTTRLTSATRQHDCTVLNQVLFLMSFYLILCLSEQCSLSVSTDIIRYYLSKLILIK